MPVNDESAPSANQRSVEEQLDELQRESERRRVELREIAAQLPATMSRRAILRAVAADFRRGRGPRAAVKAIKRTATSPRR